MYKGFSCSAYNGHCLYRGILLVVIALTCLPACSRQKAVSLKDIRQEIDYLDYKKSVSLAETYLAQTSPAKGSDKWAEATLALALSLHQRQPDTKSDKIRASELYDDIIAAMTGKPVQATALLLRARIADQIDFMDDTPDTEKARACYEHLMKDWPESPLTHQAALYIAQNEIFSMNPERARKGADGLRKWVEANPKNPMASLHWMLISLSYESPLNEPLKAMEACIHAEQAGLPPLTRLGDFFWRTANLAERGGDTKTAIRYYARIITEARRTTFAFEAQERIKALGGNPPPLVQPEG